MNNHVRIFCLIVLICVGNINKKYLRPIDLARILASRWDLDELALGAFTVFQPAQVLKYDSAHSFA